MTGGLGNQLFQYANARAVAHRMRANLLLDIRDLDTNGDGKGFALSHFNLDGKPALDADLPPSRRHRLRYLLWRRFGTNPVFVRERGLAFDASIRNVQTSCYLHGYFQSERYFEDIADRLRRELEIRTPPSRKNADLLARIATENAVSLHIRRSDYLADGNRSVYATCSLAYYETALADLASRVGPPVLYVFTDDPGWAQDKLKFDVPTVISCGNRGDQAYEDLRLMAACRHHIIANSTFSWWGAWLNPNQEKIIIAPAAWLAPEHPQNPDIIPAGWLTAPN